MGIIGTHALLYTSEPEKLRATLRDVFGWHHVDAHDGWLIFALPPAELGVHPSDGPAHELSFMCDDLVGPPGQRVRVAVVAVPVAGQVERQHPVVPGEVGRHVRPPVGVGTTAVHEHQTAPAPLAPRQVVDVGAVDGDHVVVERHRQRPPEPVRRARGRREHGGRH